MQVGFISSTGGVCDWCGASVKMRYPVDGESLCHACQHAYRMATRVDYDYPVKPGQYPVGTLVAVGAPGDIYRNFPVSHGAGKA